MNIRTLSVLMKGIIDKMEKGYTIKKLPKDGPICVLGYTFNGLKEIKEQVEIDVRLDCGFLAAYIEWNKPNPAGLHVGELYAPYPQFDGSDSSEGRFFSNFVFSKNPIEDDDLHKYSKYVAQDLDACMVHDYIPLSLLPILYYEGRGDYVLLASRDSE